MEKSTHILVVDDDREIRDLLGGFLSKHGYRASLARDGQEMKRILMDSAIDLVVLDLMMPGEDGLSLCRNLRAKSNLPVIMLTAMGEDTDRIIGLEMGADDYLAKPFNPRELLARIKAVMRRVGEAPTVRGEANLLAFEGWKLKLNERELLSPDDVVVPVSGGEYDMLVAFLEHPQRVLSRDQLLDFARGRDAQPFDRAIDVQVSRLRKKLEKDPKEPTMIKTVRGGGYIFSAKVEKVES